MKTLILIFLTTLGFSRAGAQIPQPDPDTTAKHFLIVASIGNLQEIAAGQLAAQKSKSAAIRSFGQMMQKDHGQAQQQLIHLAKSQAIDLPASATGGIEPDLNLKNAGTDFDKLYIHAMASAHRSAVEMFEIYATNGKNPNVKAFAQQLLPTLKAHLAAITALDKQLIYN